MSWLYEKQKFESEKNGTIVCRRLFGRRKVTVAGYDQSSTYITKMWRNALCRIPRDASVKRALLLGLGAGSSIEMTARRFPGSRTTAIEWDPVMVEIAERLRLIRMPIEIIRGDAASVLPALDRQFDLILFDLFRGPEPCALLTDKKFLIAIKNALSPDGRLIVNVFRRKEQLDSFRGLLSLHNTWRFQYNTLGLLRRFGRGQAGDPLPDGYEPYQQTAGYLDREQHGRLQAVGYSDCRGFRWHYGPLWFEGYRGDKEPPILPGPSRLIIWQPVMRLDKPAGWRRSRLQMNAFQTGVAPIVGSEYWRTWTSHAQRHRRRFLRETEFEIAEGMFDEFVPAYKKISRLWLLKNDFVALVAGKIKRHDGLVHLFLARRRDDGRIVAGLAVLDIPESRQSNHLISFISPEAERHSVGVGLIDVWFKHAVASGLRFLDFGVFWSPGDSRSWKGFSKFKSQFGVHLIRYPHPLIRFVGRKAEKVVE